jgi:hypothetical protein
LLDQASGYKTYDGAKVRALLNKEEVLQTLVYLAWTGPCVTPDLLTQVALLHPLRQPQPE